MISLRFHRTVTSLKNMAEGIHLEASGPDKGWNPVQLHLYLRTASHLIEEAQRHLVALQRERGASWEEIADCMGVTKQAAWQRYS